MAAVAADYGTAPIPDHDPALLGYAEKLTREPASVTVEDTQNLRFAGFDDPAILDICQVTAYFAFVNRLADGLGVELESD